MSSVAIEIIESPERLDEIEADWTRLWDRLPAALVFQHPAWLLPWQRQFAPVDLFTLAAWGGAKLLALAPGYIEAGPLGRRILPLGISLSDHLDILADPACRDAALAAIADAAQSRREVWDVWELEELPPEASALRLPLPGGCADSIAPQSACPALALPPGIGLSGLLQGGKRRHLNLARNRAGRRDGMRIAEADAAMAPETLGHLMRLHGTRWTSRGESGVLADTAVQAFQHDAVPRLQAAGLLRLTTLSLDGVVAAAQYELLTRDTASIYLTGFDPAFQHESPSVILLAQAIETALAEGRRSVDLLRGREPYKYTWGAVDVLNVKRSIRRVSDG